MCSPFGYLQQPGMYGGNLLTVASIFMVFCIGFKSVFLVSRKPYIFSNGYQVRLSEIPDKERGVGYVVPEWVHGEPTISDIHHIYGTRKVLPTTTIILPLKPNKVAAVRKHFSQVHFEVLLFLSKNKRLSVRECNGENFDVKNVSTIAISNEANLCSANDQET